MKMHPQKMIWTCLLTVTAGLLSACYNGVNIEVAPTVSFDLPEGWEIIIEDPGYTAATTNKPSKTGLADRVKLETMPGGAFAGTDQDAQDYIRDLQAQAQAQVTLPVPGWPASEVQAISLFGGAFVYAKISPDIFWGDENGEITWGSIIAHSRNGYVVTMYLSDRADLYLDELNTIAQSTRVIRH